MNAQNRRTSPTNLNKILHMKGTDQEKIRKFIFKEFPEVYAYHENPRNPTGWSDCFLQRKTWS